MATNDHPGPLQKAATTSTARRNLPWLRRAVQAGFALWSLWAGWQLFRFVGHISWVCPIGLVHELLGGLSRKLFRRRIDVPRWADIPLRGVKYLLRCSGTEVRSDS